MEAQDENNHCLVAEAGGKAVGFISICSDVNVEFLQVRALPDVERSTLEFTCVNCRV